MNLVVGVSGRGRALECAGIGVRFDAVLAGDCRCASEQSRFRGVAANGGQGGELVERTRERNDNGSARVVGNRGLAFQGARFGGRLAPRLFRFRRQVGCEPFADAAFQRHGTIALPDE